MRILTINTKFEGGGAAKIAYSIHENINKNTSHQSIFLAGYGNAIDKNCVKINNDKFKYLSALSFRLTSKEINITSNIEKYIKSADVVHIHNLHGYYINYKKVIELIVKYDKPLVWTLHDIWAFTGRCAIASDCNKWESGCNNCKYKNLYPKSFIDNTKNEYYIKKELFDKLNINKTVIVTPSIWLKKLTERSLLKNFTIVNIPNGIEITNSYKNKKNLRAKFNLPNNKKIVLFIAANPNDKLKGINLLFNSIDKLQDVLFISVGKKVEYVNDNFIQLGYISNQNELKEIYSLADVYVNPSLSENFPTTNLEAFVNRVPTIAFKVGGIVEQLEENCGVLVDKICEKNLTENIVKLLHNEDLQKIIIENAYKKCKNEYSYNAFIDNYKKIYIRLVGE